MLYCHARPFDETMTLESLALTSEHDQYNFVATREEDPETVRHALRKFIADVTAADAGRRPVIAVEGFGFDEPVPKLVFEKAHGLFPSGMSALVYWQDISPAVHEPPPRPIEPLAAARALRDEFLSRQSAWRRRQE